MQCRAIKPFLLLCFVLLISCSEQSQQFSPLSDNATILAFGDSLTFGKGASRSQSYPSVLQSLSHLRVINAGISGEVSADGLKRLPALLSKHLPELVIICHGGNDILRRHNTQQTKANIIKMIALAKSHNAQVMLLAVPRPSLLLTPAEFYAEIAEATKTIFDPETMPGVLADRRLKSDSIHPNSAGYAAIAEHIFRKLKELGALKSDT